MKSQTPRFRLTKWYFDCLSAAETTIVYRAQIEWHAARLHYSSLLHRHEDTIANRSSVRRFDQTEDNSSDLLLRIPSLHLEGNWIADASACQRTVLSCPEGSVEWHCLQPRSKVVLKIAGQPIVGTGYVERLQLNMPPWKLPLTQLHWGRFHSAQHTVIWIAWRGAHEFQLVLHNGRERSLDLATPRTLEFGSHFVLELEPKHILRDGALSHTILPGAPTFRTFFPDSLFGIRETKWESRGRLHTPEGNEDGWAIHEVVDWCV